ncbi:MAG: glycoside hydrolase family 18 protein [Fibrobacterota bacterium]
MHRVRYSVFLIVFLICSIASANVISWVPPYGIDDSWSSFESEWSGYGPPNGLTWLALQFWVPDGSGGLTYTSRYEGVGDSPVIQFRDKAREHGVKTMLCVYNGEWGWDWDLVAQSVSNTNRQDFINALITEMERLELDGIEVDLEGPNGNDYATQESNFITFVEELSDTLSSLGKDLTIATFASREYDHIPDASHWSILLPLVDGLTSMGYEETGIYASGDLSYAGQKSMASAAPEKLMLGMPDHVGSWQNSSALEQVTWARDNGVGVGLWDMQLRDAAWETAQIWEHLNTIRGEVDETYTITAHSSEGGSISPSGEITLAAGESQTFSFEPEESYVVSEIYVDDAAVGAHDTYTIENITSNTTIKAVFEEDPQPPEDIVLSSSQGPAEEADALIGELEAVDPNPGEHTFTVVEGSDDFYVDGDNLLTKRALAEGQYEVTIEAEDPEELTLRKGFTIGIVDDDLITGENLSAYLGWYVYHDEYGTSVDTGQSLMRDDSIAAVGFDMAAKDSENGEYPYGALSASLDTNLADPEYIIVEYRTTHDFEVVLPMETVTQEGGEYRTQLENSGGSWQRDTLYLDSDLFSQPEWADTEVFDKSTTREIEFAPAFENTSGDVAVRVLKIDGFTLDAVSICEKEYTGERRETIALSGTRADNLRLRVTEPGEYTLGVFTLSGRRVAYTTRNLREGENAISLPGLSSGYAGVLLFSVEGSGQRRLFRKRF